MDKPDADVELMRILLTGTDADEGQRLLELMTSTAVIRLEILQATGVEKARELQQRESFELILFDLHKGEADLSALAALLNRNLGAQVLALVWARDESLGKRAVKMGVRQYCVKEQLLTDTILCIAEYASQRAQAAVNAGKKDKELQRPLRMFQERAAVLTQAGNAQGSGEGRSLKERDKESFHQFVRRFGDVLELALERLVYKVEINTSNTLKLLAEEMGMLKAGPRDIVDIYSTCLESKRHKANEQRYKGYAEEGRLLLIETMGHLLSFYRNLALAGPADRCLQDNTPCERA